MKCFVKTLRKLYNSAPTSRWNRQTDDYFSHSCWGMNKLHIRLKRVHALVFLLKDFEYKAACKTRGQKRWSDARDPGLGLQTMFPTSFTQPPSAATPAESGLITHQHSLCNTFQITLEIPRKSAPNPLFASIHPYIHPSSLLSASDWLGSWGCWTASHLLDSEGGLDPGQAATSQQRHTTRPTTQSYDSWLSPWLASDARLWTLWVMEQKLGEHFWCEWLFYLCCLIVLLFALHLYCISVFFAKCAKLCFVWTALCDN